MRLATALFLILPFATSAHAQTAPITPPQAQVTFYSRPRNAGYPFHQLQGFMGTLFKEDQKLASFKPGHFITFQLPAGTYVFTGTLSPSKNVKAGDHLSLTLNDGDHRFVEMLVFSGGVLSVRPLLKEVTCEGAVQDNVKNRQLDQKYLSANPAAVPIMQTALPTCTQQSTP